VFPLEERENEDENCTWIGTPSVFAPRLRKEAGVGVTNNQQAKVCWLHLSSTFPNFVATLAPYDYTLLKEDLYAIEIASSPCFSLHARFPSDRPSAARHIFSQKGPQGRSEGRI
jgi:hypothetical protein